MEKNYEEFLQGAEYRKTWSIAFFNATNAAIEMVKDNHKDFEEAKEKIVAVRDWLLKEHARYYAENIAPVGMEAFTPKVAEGLDKAKKLYENQTRTTGK